MVKIAGPDRHKFGIPTKCKKIYIRITHVLSLKGWQKHPRYSSKTPTFYKNYLAMRNTVDVTAGKSIAVRSEYISGVSAVNPLVAFYDIKGRKREVLFLHETKNLN
jgi:hypothetical protein